MLWSRLSRRLLVLRREDGIALVVALGVLLVLTVTTVTAVQMATGSQQTISLSQGGQTAYANGQGGVNNAEAMLNYDLSNNINPSSPTDFGCGTGTSGASNCTTYTPITFCLQTTTCTAGTAGTASVYGWFSGTNSGTFDGQSVAASTWLIVSTGYAKGASATTLSWTRTATITVSAANSGTIAAVWNHVFLTAPLVNNVCQNTLSANTINLYVPIYSIGNFCITGNTDQIYENGQPIDLMIGGKLAIWGNTDNIGQNASTPITSGVVVGGCTTTNNNWTTHACGSSDRYWVKNTDTFISQDAPTLTGSQITADYAGFDPGPDHPCASPNTGTYSGWATLANSVFDNDATQNDSAGTFTLTPATNYACISQSGAGTGELIWNASTKALTINGNIFIDGNLSISQNVTYSGVGEIMAAGTVSYANGQNNVAVCASGTNCTFTNWEGATSNTSMLTLSALAASNASAISIPTNTDIFQGSLWCQPSSGLTIGGNTIDIQGPISVGTMTISGNTPNLEPLPVIKNMPTGAPVPPNTGATVGTPNYTS